MVSFCERMNEGQLIALDSTSLPMRSLSFEPFDAESTCVLRQVRAPTVFMSAGGIFPCSHIYTC